VNEPVKFDYTHARDRTAPGHTKINNLQRLGLIEKMPGDSGKLRYKLSLSGRAALKKLLLTNC
jgi:hypothetical protein